MSNAILKNDVAARIARRALAKRGADYESEVRRLLDAALEVIQQGGTTSRARVADIVATAGLSNDAFYRHFPSKDALVAALIEDGAERLASYVAHQMAKEQDPAAQVRRWVEGIMSQTRDDIAATTLAVLWNGGMVGESFVSARHSAPLAPLLHDPFARLGSADPEMDASLVTHAILGKMSDYLWQRATPTSAEIEHITDFCLKAIENQKHFLSERTVVRPPGSRLASHTRRRGPARRALRRPSPEVIRFHE